MMNSMMNSGDIITDPKDELPNQSEGTSQLLSPISPTPTTQVLFKKSTGIASASDDVTSRVVYDPLSPPEPTAFDLMKLAGNDGVWQITIFILGSLCGFNTAIHSFVMPFIAEASGRNHHCLLPSIPSSYDLSHDDLRALLIPKDKKGIYSRCFIYEHIVGPNYDLSVNRKVQVGCNEHEFHPTFNETTIASEWNLVCDRAYLLSNVQSLFMTGVLIGSAVFGSLSDKFGRRYGIWLSSMIFLVSAPATALSPNYTTLLICRILLGLATAGVYTTSYVLVVECIGPKHRGLAGLLFTIPFTLGYIVLPVIAYFIRDWRNLQITLSTFSVFLFVSWWFMPESPRWFLSRGQAKEAEYTFRKIAKTNERQLPDNFGELVEKVAAVKKIVLKKSYCHKIQSILIEVLRTLRYKRLALRLLIISVSFLAISLVYYGIAINAENIGIDKYLFTFLCGLFEIPATLMTPPLINSFLGRRITFSGLMILCGVFLWLSLLLPTGSTPAVLLAVLAQLFISSCYSLAYLYASELLPTVKRAFGLGIALTIGRSGSIAAPYIVQILGEENPTYPTIIFGSTALAAGALTIFLPETRGKRLPDTIEDVEKG